MKSLSTACLIVIGDEVLSGRTEDKNINFIAKRCDTIGINLAEVRIIPDDHKTIQDTEHLRDAEIEHLLTQDPQACLKVSFNQDNVKLVH